MSFQSERLGACGDMAFFAPQAVLFFDDPSLKNRHPSSHIRRYYSSEYFFDHVPRHIGQTKIPPFVSVGQLCVIEPQTMQDCCL